MCSLRLTPEEAFANGADRRKLRYADYERRDKAALSGQLLGAPDADLSGAELATWLWLAPNAPWLRETDRLSARLLVKLKPLAEGGDAKALASYMRALSKLCLSPVDRKKLPPEQSRARNPFERDEFMDD